LSVAGQIAWREWRPDDLAQIALLEVELFGVGAWSYQMVAEELAAPGRYYVVADAMVTDAQAPGSNGQVVGYAGLWFDGEVTQIMTIGVAPHYQHQGIGRMLLQQLIDQSIQLEAVEMFLEVAVDNEPAISLYREFGFIPLGIRKRYYPGNRDAYTMRLTLT